MSEEPKPIFVPPKQKWRPWNTPRIQKFIYYAQFPRGRFITYIIGCSTFYLLAYNIGVYLWKGREHPINNVRWLDWKSRGLLSPEMLEKERLVLNYDKYIWEKNTTSIIPTVREEPGKLLRLVQTKG